MSRLGGAAAVAPLVADMSSEVHIFSFSLFYLFVFNELKEEGGGGRLVYYHEN